MAASSGDAQKRGAWQARFARYRASGLSVSRFCGQEGVSTNTFYYWAKRLRSASAPAHLKRSMPLQRASAPPAPDNNTRRSLVRFRWKTGMEVRVPAECLAVIRCLAECFATTDNLRSGAFQEVVVRT